MCLKESALPVIKESQVVIHVEKITKEEREQILYNHIKLGKQKNFYKKKIKPFLPDVVSNKKFSPELARRLGIPMFTKNLTISKSGLNNFVEKPLDLLCEIISTLDDSSRSALALVFINGGALSRPLNITAEEKQVIERFGGTVGDVAKSLESFSDSLLLNIIKNGNYYWQFKHPTIRDAFATIVASNQDFMDIYLTGAPLEKIFLEISCGDVGIQGVSVIVSENQYNMVINKIKQFDTTKWYNKFSLCRFLAYRCDKKFFIKFIGEFPDFISSLSIGSSIYADPGIDVLVKLSEFDLLPEEKRSNAVSIIKKLAVETPDSGFLRERIRTLMSPDELSDILESVKCSLLPDLDGTISSWIYNYDSEEDPDMCFDGLKRSLEDYKSEFEEDAASLKQLNEAIAKVDEATDDLRSQYTPKETEDSWWNSSSSSSTSASSRSIFDDVDQ
ncbi:MAG: hypothetical protein AB7D07_12200 [Desulfovibrionaceae bacterium]